MILCLIILIVGIIALVIGGFAAYKSRKAHCFSNWDYVSAALITCGIVATLIATTFLIVMPIVCNNELDKFINQKEYIENYELTSEYDTAAIANKKIELNEWLYSVQHTKEHYPICSFFSDEILKIEPIK